MAQILEEQAPENVKQHEGVSEWVLHIDGSFMNTGSGARVVIRIPDGFEMKYSLRLIFPTTNNIAEYKALLVGLRLAKECSAKRLAIYNDSKLIVNQVNWSFEASNPHLARYLTKVREAAWSFDKLIQVHVLKSEI
ncbi:hypothetical protein Nepgr_026982 [Nepenthes gracilis]|uniref:RNase H type-1 domain-containing protein n=1 Tax=Nepenthes gracilis TaxID=150966 RepID=A0AAD3Y2N3_NEPGR|nr:hypothetical protein Nepgr_026982 [Nepenthes gracilis]